MQVWENLSKKIIMQLKKDKKILLVSLSVGFASCFIWGIFATQAYSETIQTGISQKVVRFHVRANSDTAEDQRLKLAVRDCILSEMGEELEACKDVEETKKLLQHSLERIERVAQKEIAAQGYDNSVKAYLTTELFPKKQYGDLTFPSGMYTALRVDIGEAKGQNWWCVMFPPMCYVDAACQEVTEETKGRLAGTLTTEEYTVVASLDGKQGITPQVKFKVVELWQEKKAKDTKPAKPSKPKNAIEKKTVKSHNIKKHTKG